MPVPPTLKSYWVIFDTCARPAYYLDVHNILALPRGYIYRYNYKKSQISDAAWTHATKFAEAPVRILLVYCQYVGHRQGNDLSIVPKDCEKIWIGTRLGKLAHIQIDGDSAYFDMELEGFPAADSSVLARIISDLEHQGDTPWNKWVVISGCPTELEILTERGDDASNWNKIIVLAAEWSIFERQKQLS
jgi:hypothetical protein